MRHPCLYTALPLLLLISTPCDASPQTIPQDAAQRALPFQISVDVHLVVLNATVRNSKGGFASDLQEQNFAVYEDGVRQTVSLFRHDDIPVTVGLIVDHSGSMRRKLPEVVAAAQTFVRASSPQDEMFVVNFNEQIALGLSPDHPLTNRPGELGMAIANTPAYGKTALYDAVIEGRKWLRTGTREKRVLVVISDGGDNASKHTLADVLQLARESNALIYTVGIFDSDDPDRNPSVLRKLAEATGGEAYFPADLKEVVPICERIASDIRNQYTLGYVPAGAARPGAYRSIRVLASAEGYRKLHVRTRAGYIATP